MTPVWLEYPARSPEDEVLPASPAVTIQADQLGSQFRESLDFPVGIANLDGDIPALEIAGHAQFLSKDLDERSVRGRRAGSEHADPMYPALGLLSLGGERR
jgi:hypothetical protein